MFFIGSVLQQHFFIVGHLNLALPYTYTVFKKMHVGLYCKSSLRKNLSAIKYISAL